MSPELLLVLAGGKLLLYLVQQLPPVKELDVKSKSRLVRYFAELYHCDLCLGTWVFFTLSAFCKANLTIIYVPLLSELITAAFLSMGWHLTTLGAKYKWGFIE